MNDMSEKYQIYLQRNSNEYVGVLWINHNRGKLSSVFSYDNAWLKSPISFPLSPDLPLDQNPKRCDGLFLCFQDCAPDRWGRRLLLRQEAAAANKENRKPRTLLESDFLLRINDWTRQGALRISADDGATFLGPAGPSSVPPLVNLPKLLNASRNIDAKKESDLDLRILVAPGSSLGGARPKASVVGTDDTLFIAKFPSSTDDRDIPLWEYVCFKLAQRAGITIPAVQLKEVAGKNVLLIERFDRCFEKRIPFISAMSLLEKKDGEQASYIDIAAILQAEGALPSSDLKELWSRMVFNMCIYNTDDHLRNHGFLRDIRGWRLSPIYDLENSTPQEKEPLLHTAIIDGYFAFNLQDALDAAEFFRLKQTEARQRLADIRKAVSYWKEEARRAGATPSEIKFMQDSFEFLPATP